MRETPREQARTLLGFAVIAASALTLVGLAVVLTADAGSLARFVGAGAVVFSTILAAAVATCGRV